MTASRAAGDDTLLPGFQEVTGEKKKLSADDLPRGASIGRYLIIERLGSGGMGVVYAAYDPDLNRKVAIKLLRSQPGAMASQGRARLLREAQSMARLSHPNVVAVYDVGVAFDQVFVAMEFIEGSTLGEWLSKPRRSADILRVFVEAGQGLAAAHHANIIHRDFKPDNVMIGRDGRARVMDFGVARDVSQPISDPGPSLLPSRAAAVELDLTLPEQSSRGLAALAVSSPLTQEGALMGTPRYMSPEQFRGQPSDARSDQFSFCIALYEAVCGQPPFAGDNLGELAMQVFQGHVRAFPPEKRVPKWLRGVLLRGLRVKPVERYPSLQALLDDLSPERRKRRRRLLLAVTSGVSLLLLALLLTGAYRGRQALLAQRCSAAEAQLAPVFGDAVKAQSRLGLRKTNRPYAEDVWHRVESNVTRYLTDWQTMRSETCQARFVAGSLSPELHARSLRCLDGRLQEVAAFMTMLQHADDQVLDSAVEQSSDLALLEPCGDPHFLQQLAGEQAAERERMDLLSRELSEARLFRNGGRLQQAKERAQRVLASAQQLASLPFQARSEWELSRIESASGDPYAAYHHAVAAAALGIRGGDFLTAAAAFTDLMYLSQVSQRSGMVERWQQFAEATLARVVGSTQAKARIMASLDLYLCQQSSAARQWQKADEQCSLALRDSERLFGAEASQVATVLNSLAMLNRRQDRYPEAESLYRRALTISQAHLGSEHSWLAPIHENLAVLLELMGKLDEAEAEGLRALHIAERAFGPEHPKLFGTLKFLALLQQRRQQSEPAIALAERAAKILKGTSREVMGKTLLGNVLYRAGRYEEALTWHQEALDLCTGKVCGVDMPGRLVAVADDLRALGRDAKALPLLEHALRLLPSSGDGELHAKTDFSLAQALYAVEADKSRVRVIELAERARKQYLDLGHKHLREADEVTAWLTHHKLQPPPATAKP